MKSVLLATSLNRGRPTFWFASLGEPPFEQSKASLATPLNRKAAKPPRPPVLRFWPARLARCCARFASIAAVVFQFQSLNTLAAPGTVAFANHSSTKILNGYTGNALAATDGVLAALYWAPAGTSNFVQLGAPATVGVPVAGLFAGGARTCGAATPGGAVGQFQVRAWSGGYATYEQALAAFGVILGQSAVLQVVTGDPAGDPPMPPNSLLSGGLQSFSLFTNANPVTPLSLLCSTNKSVPCGSAWSFDPPTTSGGCSSNATVGVLSTVTNGQCSSLITRTWWATDGCTTSTCSQVVTIMDATPPVLTCASNKTAVCGSAWSFDPPVAVDACSGTNVTLAVVSTITNGVCPATATRIWSATDGCGNSNLCSQVVTLAAAQSVVSYTDKPQFLSASGAGPLSLNQFNDLSYFGITGLLTYQIGTNPVYSISSPPALGVLALGGAACALDNGSDPFLRIDIPGGATAIGANFYATDYDGVFVAASLRVTLSDGTTQSVAIGSISQFLGFVSGGQLITRLEVHNPNFGSDGLYPTMDNLYVVRAAAPPLAPSIAAQPQSQTNQVGASTSFAVTATGTAPLSYRWKLSGTNLTDGIRVVGSTSNQLTLLNLLVSDSGGYSVTVSNAAGATNSQAATLTVLKVTPAIPWPTPAAITYGTPLSSAQLNATSAVPGAYVYTPPAGAVPIAGPNALSVTFTPTDTNNYNLVTTGTTLVVIKAPLSVTASNASRPYGQTNPVFSGSVVGVVNSDPITANFACSATPASLPGDYAIVPVLSDPNGRLGNYTLTTNNGTLTVTGNAPLITAQPQSLTNQVGTSASFSVTATGTAPLAYQWRFNGTNLTEGARVVGATSNQLTLLSVMVADAGPYSVVVSNAAGTTNSQVATLTVLKATPSVPWAMPAAITYGTALSAAQLSATSSVGGAYVYTPPAGTVLGAGTNSLSVTFTPTDTNNYSLVTTGTTLVVLKSALSVTASNVSRAYGQTNPVFSGTIAGLVNSDPITASYSCSATPASLPGNYAIVPTLNDPGSRLGNYTTTTNNGTLTVTPAAPPTIASVAPNSGPTNGGASVTILGSGFQSGATVRFGGLPAASVNFVNATNLLAVTPPSAPGAVSVVVTNADGQSASLTNGFTFFGSGGCVAPPSGLVSWWRAEGDPSDALGGNNGVLTNGTTFAPGLKGQAFWLDGVDDYILVPDSPNLNPSNGITLEAWVKTTGTAIYSSIVDKLPSSPTLLGRGYQLFVAPGGSPGFSAGSYYTYSAFAYGPKAITDGIWHHVAATYDGTTASVYVDGLAGIPVAAAASAYWGSSTQSLKIGWDPYAASRHFTGLIDEFSLYNRALTSNEIAVIFSAGSAGKCTGGQAPSITSQPQSQTVPLGSNATFTVTATGTAPLSYQWRKNSGNLTTQTNATLTLTNVQLAHAGNYDVVVSNALGSVTSAPPATLSIVSGDIAFFDDTFSDTNWTLTVLTLDTGGVQGAAQAATGGNPGAYRRITNSVNLPSASTNSSGVYGFHKRAGAYDPQVQGAIAAIDCSKDFIDFGTGGALTGPALWQGGKIYRWNFRFRDIESTWTNKPLVGLCATNFCLVTTNLPYSWDPNNHPDFSAQGTPINFGFFSYDEASYVSGGKTYIFGIDNWSVKVWRVISAAPVILSPPTNQVVVAGSSASFIVVASGAVPLSYQWRREGTALPAQTNATITLANVQLADAGNYDVVVSNAFGSVTSAPPATLTVTPVCVPPPAGLVAWWRGENNALDFVGTNNGTLRGGATFAAGRVGQAFSLDGVDDYVEVSNAPALNPPNAITVEAWYKPTVSFLGDGGNPIVQKAYVSHSPPYYQYSLWVTGDQYSPAARASFGFYISPGGTNDGPHTPPGFWSVGQWYHLVGTYDGSTVKLYVNGSLITNTLASGSVTDYGQNLHIGRFSNFSDPGAYTPGLVDEVSLYNRALTANEIAAIYSAGSLGKCLAAQAPAITAQPQSQTNTVGSSTSFVVTATGTAPLAYQWWFQGTNLLAGATNSTLTFSNLVSSLAGGYFAVVSNSVGSATSAVATLTVLKATPTLTWSNPAPVVYGTALGTNQLNASPSVAGSFAYSPTNGAVLTVGSNVLSVVFTPTNIANFNVVTGTVALVVLPAPLTVTASNAARSYGAANPVFTGTLTGVTNGDNLSASFACAATPANPVGAYPIMGTVVDPNGRLGNYTVVTNNGLLTVFKATPTLTWTNPAPVVYGTALGTNQLNASPSVNGGFAYAPTNGTVLDAGSNLLSVVFTPTDAVNFNSVTGSVAIVVQKASLNVTANNAMRAYGVTNPPLTGILTGVTNGDPVTATYSCAATPASPPGGYAIVPVLSDPSGRLGNYIVTTNNGTLTVTNSAPLITTQPQSQSVVVGSNVTFIVTATGIPPLSYQWQFNGTNLTTGGRISGATSTNLTITNVQLSDLGNYSVLVSSFGNGTTSTVVKLTVVAPTPARPQGSVVGFGWNAAGQTDVPAGLTNVVAVAAGYDFSLAVRNGGQVVAWGNSYYGSTAVPADLTNAVSVAAGNYVGMALRNDGTVVAWGNDGGSQQTRVPAELTNATAIAAGGGHSLALRNDGSVMGWGNIPGTAPADLTNAVAIAAGGAHCLALRNDGTAVTWGNNAYGQLSMPAGLSNLTAIAGGSLHSLALRKDGTVVAWGDNTYGQTNVPAGLGNVVAIAAGHSHSVALRSDGSVVAWGRNHVGQTDVPAGLTNAVAINGGPYAFHCLAIVNASGGSGLSNAPAITTQPQSVTTVVGGTASFSVTATGSAPLSYQWRLNGTNLADGTRIVGSTSNQLTILSVLITDTGGYSVSVSNISGATNSQAATLTVLKATPVVTWATPAAITYGTALDGAQLNATSSVSGACVYTPPGGTVPPAGTHTLSVVFTPTNTASYNAVTGSVVLVVQQAALNVTANNATRPYGGTNPIFTGTLLGVTNGDPITATYSCAATPASLPGPYGIVPALVDTQGRLSNYLATLQNGTLTVTATPPLVITQPVSLTTAVGASASLSVGVSGTPPLAYQWRFIGGPLPGATNSTLSFPSAQLTNSGSYDVVITNIAGSATSQVATLTVTNVVTPRVVRLLSTTNWPGASVSLPVELRAQGDENTVAFSLTFDPTYLAYQGNALGTGVLVGAQLLVNTNDAGQGRIGVLLGLPSGVAFTTGTQQLVVLTFQVATSLTIATNLPVDFGNQPVAQEIGSVNADVLPAQFVGGVVVVTPGYEADVSPRPNGDGRLTATDWTLIGRFVAGLSTISNSSEFARADCAPRSTLGDGRITATDWTQAGRYVVGLDAPRLVGGPSSLLSLAFGPSPGKTEGDQATRLLRLVDGVASPEGQVTVPLELEAQGDENTLAFSVNFDPALLRYDAVAHGSALPLNAQLMLNTNTVNSGRLGVLLGLPSGSTFAAGTQQVLVITLRANAPAGAGNTLVGFGDDPVFREVGSAAAEVLPADYVSARINFGSVAPPTLDIVLGADSQVKLTLRGASGAVCRVDYLSELGATNWWPLTTVTLGSTNTAVVDPQPPTNQTRFYRAVRLP